MPTLARTIHDTTRTARRSFAGSLPNAQELAQSSLQRDIEEASDDGETLEVDNDDDEEDETNTLRPSTSVPNNGFVGSYRRPSFAGAGPRGVLFGRGNYDKLTKEERQRALEEERSLLRDNKIIPPKHSDGPNKTMFHIPFANGQEETTPLLRNSSLPYGGQDDPQQIVQKWSEAVEAGKIQTTWQREAKVLATYSLPLMVTFLLQYSLTLASVFAVGHLGTVELGAVSIATMTANITGYAVYQGLATSLDTLCAQAYGSGKKKLVGLQMQRMIIFLWVLTVPIAIIWLLADKFLVYVVPEKDVAILAGLYLKVVLAGAPGYAAFEAAKRYAQAQGLFSASLYVLLICAPINAFLNWYLVWYVKIGFIGAPIAVAITDNLLPVGLLVYIRFFSKSGMSCWNGFTRKAFSNWGPMIKLALPGLVIVEAEFVAFEILTFASSFFGTSTLAAQSVLATISSTTYQIPFSLSIAGSTRVANLIGATLPDAARVATRVTITAAVLVGVFNVTMLSALKNLIPRLFTSDEIVVSLVSGVLPLCAAFQLFDALAACANGVLRGLGQQEFGGYVQLFCYYAIAMPLSFGTAFGAHWGIWGLWTGVALALGIVAAIEYTYLYGYLDWNKCVDEAQERNLADA